MQTQQLSPPYPDQHHGAQLEHYFHQVQAGDVQTSLEPTYQPAEYTYSVSDDMNNESTVDKKDEKESNRMMGKITYRRTSCFILSCVGW
jgi:hypothetical protein